MAATRYSLFKNLTFLSYCSHVHISYKPGTPKTDVAKRMVIMCTSQDIKKKYPNLNVTWEFLAYDAPPTLAVQFVNGEKHRILINEFSRVERKAIADKFALEAEFGPHPEHVFELNDIQKKRLEEMISKGEWTPPVTQD